MAIVVQSLSQSNQVLKQAVFPGTSLVLGRGYFCDHHIDDPYVCEEHAQVFISDDKQLEIADKQSLNGTIINGTAQQQQSIEPHDIILLGRSRFRIFLANTAVQATKKLNQLDLFLDRFNKKRIVYALFAFFVCLTCLDTYLNASSKIEVSLFMTPLVGALTLICLPVFMVALLGVLNKKESRLLLLFNLVLTGFVLSLLFPYVVSFVTFNIDNAQAIHYLEKAVTWILIIAILYVALYAVFRQSTKKRVGIVAGVVGIYFIVQYLPQMFDDNDYIAFPQHGAKVMSPSLLFNSSQSTDEFINDSADLFELAKRETEE